MSKADIQPMLDDLVKAAKIKHCGQGLIFGVPIEELTKEELIGVISMMDDNLRASNESHSKTLELMKPNGRL